MTPPAQSFNHKPALAAMAVAFGVLLLAGAAYEDLAFGLATALLGTAGLLSLYAFAVAVLDHRRRAVHKR